MRKLKQFLLCLVVETSSYVILYFQVCIAYPIPKWIGSYTFKIYAEKIQFFGSNNWALKFRGAKGLRNIKPLRSVHIVTTVLRGLAEHVDRINILFPCLHYHTHLLFPDTAHCFQNLRPSVILSPLFIDILFHQSPLKCYKFVIISCK